MGTRFLFLTILPRRIDTEAWGDAYDEVHALWRAVAEGLAGYSASGGAPDVEDAAALLPEVPALPPGHAPTRRGCLLSLHQQAGRTAPRAVYLREVEHWPAQGDAQGGAQGGPPPAPDATQSPTRLRHLQICGDARTRLVGEPFRIYRDLGIYRRRLLSPGEGPDDILLPNPSQSAEVAVFSGETTGAPYQRAVLAAAMLIEARFPGAALCFGELDRAEAEAAAALCRATLGQDTSLPVCVDAQALWARLVGVVPTVEGLWHSVLAWFRGEPGVAHEELLRLSGKDAGVRWLRSELGACRSLQQYGAMQRMVEWLNATQDLETLLRVACLDPEGPRFPLTLMVSAVVDTCVTCAPAARVGLQALAPLRVGARQSGLAQLLDLQLAEALVDLQLAGRRIRAYLPLPEAEEALRRCLRDAPWGDEDPAPQIEHLVRRLRAETGKRAQSLTDLCGPVLRSVEALRARLFELDPVHLLRERRVKDLPPRAQRALLAYGMSLQGLLVQIEREPELAVLLDSRRASSLALDQRGLLRARAIALLERQGQALTAEAWAELDGGRPAPDAAANDNAAQGTPWASPPPPAGPRPLMDPEDEGSLRFLIALVLAAEPALGLRPAPVSSEGEDVVAGALRGGSGDQAPRAAYRRALLENGPLRRDLVRQLRAPGLGGLLELGLEGEDLPANDQHDGPLAVARAQQGRRA